MTNKLWAFGSRFTHRNFANNGVRCAALILVLMLAALPILAQSTSFSETQGEHVFYVDSNFHVRQAYWNTGSWSTQDLTSLSGATTVANSNYYLTSFSDMNGMHVFYTGSDGNIYQLYMSWGSGWVNQLIASPGGLLTSSFADNLGEHVLYVSADHHIRQVVYAWGGGFSYQDLTALAGGGRAVIAAAFVDSNPQHVVGEHVAYIGYDDEHIHQLYLPAGGSWQDQDLTRLSGMPLNCGGPITTFVDAWGEHVLSTCFAGGVSHIYQLYLPWGGNWVYTDLTSLTGANPVGASLVAFADVMREHVYYTDVNGHVNELYTQFGWINQDLTAATKSIGIGGPSLCSGVQLSAFSDATGEHVFYLGADSSFHHLQWKPNVWTDQKLNVAPYIAPCIG